MSVDTVLPAEGATYEKESAPESGVHGLLIRAAGAREWVVDKRQFLCRTSSITITKNSL